MKIAAIKTFQDIVGAENVLLGEQVAPYHKACIPVEREIPAVIKAKTVEQVSDIVKAANEFKTPLYTISTGNNWGYATKNPVTDGNFILDLIEMKSIEVNKNLAYAIVEPGVTQEMLCRYLAEHDTGLIMDPTGSGPSCSVLGNALERGYGITPMGNHFESICGMEVVLANGKILKTGFSHFEKSRAKQLFKYGTGPYLDGIFTQSNFGIVTRIGVWLMPAPEYFEACYFGYDSDEDLSDLIENVRWLLLNKVVKGSINLLHRNRVLIMQVQHPDRCDGVTPLLTEEKWQELAQQQGIMLWNGVVALYGTREEVKAAKKVIKRTLGKAIKQAPGGKKSRMNFVSDALLNFVERAVEKLPAFFWEIVQKLTRINVPETLRVMKPSYHLMKGTPCEVSLPLAYWRTPNLPDLDTPFDPAKPFDPARDNSGLYWLSPVVPLEVEELTRFRGIIEEVFNDHGFECCITLTTVEPRCLDCSVPILFNKFSEEETARAKSCYEAALEACLESGYIPNRFGVQSMEKITAGEDVFWDTAADIKKTLDPNNILSPGRYSKI